MQSPPLDPDVADIAPTERALTPYDHEHAITYLRMLDADAEGADWREVSLIVLHIDPDQHAERARRASIAISRALNGCREKDRSIYSDTAGLPRTNGQSEQPCDHFGSLPRPTYGSGKPAAPIFTIYP